LEVGIGRGMVIEKHFGNVFFYKTAVGNMVVVRLSGFLIDRGGRGFVIELGDFDGIGQEGI
jgi:hypothetical protein